MIRILNIQANQAFLIGDREVILESCMDLADAKTIDQQYPGVYLKIIEPTDKTADKAETTK